MKIYFAGSIRGGRDDKEFYSNLIKHISVYGKVLTEHVGDENLVKLEKNLSDQEIFNRDLELLQEADVLIAEVSTPSLGVGYEIATAEAMNKKILCLYRILSSNKRLSAMINGNSKLKIANYKNLNEAFYYIDNFLN